MSVFVGVILRVLRCLDDESTRFHYSPHLEITRLSPGGAVVEFVTIRGRGGGIALWGELALIRQWDPRRTSVLGAAQVPALHHLTRVLVSRSNKCHGLEFQGETTARSRRRTLLSSRAPRNIMIGLVVTAFWNLTHVLWSRSVMTRTSWR
ncbi:hypothetical protein F5Y19DRAFT_64356 [Xylariaceae sp. FL1651]|nr:hypothetical protein F5Y19DRAFT_64356 [Xylariaceae sp. FL1651]